VSRQRKRYKLTPAQTLLLIHLKELGLQAEPEFQFTPDRRWRLDTYVAEARIGIECNGGRYKFGHRSSRDTDKDNEKMNTAQMMGIRVLQFTNEQIMSGEAKEFVKAWL
jgi:very-short-patch-repair endonuclease